MWDACSRRRGLRCPGWRREHLPKAGELSGWGTGRWSVQEEFRRQAGPRLPEEADLADCVRNVALFLLVLFTHS